MDQVILREKMEAVQQIGICKLLDQLFPGYWDEQGYLKYDWEQTSKAVMDWCAENNAHYYARPKEDFFPNSGALEAVELGKTIVVLEDLS